MRFAALYASYCRGSVGSAKKRPTQQRADLVFAGVVNRVENADAFRLAAEVERAEQLVPERQRGAEVAGLIRFRAVVQAVLFGAADQEIQRADRAGDVRV